MVGALPVAAVLAVWLVDGSGSGSGSGDGDAVVRVGEGVALRVGGRVLGGRAVVRPAVREVVTGAGAAGA
jgi:hypothetical protein